MEFGLCIEMALTGLPFEKRIEKAAEIGFKNVEMWFVDMSYSGSPGELARLAERHGVRITNTVIGAPDGSIGGGLTDPLKRDEWIERTKQTLAFNKEAHIPASIVCTGNVIPDLDDEIMYESVIEGLKATVDLAEKAGITLLLEPLNDRHDHPNYWLTSSDLGAAICRAIGSPRLRLLFDCYHMQIMDGDLVDHIKGNIDVIGHFHSAGVPGRNEVFIGEIRYPYVIKQIEEAGYKGIFGLEFAPSMDDEQSLRQTLAHLKGQ
ncbi:MAG: TIM barrel protein [Candidatus Hydrogenedentes bacterium]|nr:TIM barrel protein [Candidatus Hydrogenedentota bacterium]